jgi:IS30 family transposase
VVVQKSSSPQHTTTYDNATELALQKLLAEILEADAYFAHPHRSWERGLNENTHGLIRQNFPKGTNFAKVASSQVKKVERKLNRRPRKHLDHALQTTFPTHLRRLHWPLESADEGLR